MTGLRALLDLQQADGGWPYSTNCSWTEPTCYALLALRSTGGHDEAICRSAEWLVRRQRRDGGWSPAMAVEQSTHVTSLAVLALADLTGYEETAERGVGWLLAQGGAESSFWARIARFATRTQSDATGHTGWPWFPGAAAWVIPTSLAILALAKYKGERFRLEIEARVKDARSFLLSRRCPDAGWNHGGLFRAGERPSSYPETTGIALLALAGSGSAEIGPSIRCGERHAREPRSSEGDYWLRLGLRAHGVNAGAPTVKYRDWTINQMALGMIAQSAIEGRNAFVDASL